MMSLSSVGFTLGSLPTLCAGQFIIRQFVGYKLFVGSDVSMCVLEVPVDGEFSVMCASPVGKVLEMNSWMEYI